MRRLLDAMFAPWLVSIIVIFVLVGLIATALDAAGWLEPDYRRLLAAMTLAYFACAIWEWRSESGSRFG